MIRGRDNHHSRLGELADRILVTFRLARIGIEFGRIGNPGKFRRNISRRCSMVPPPRDDGDLANGSAALLLEKVGRMALP
jgi:hypothetical protein